MKKHKTFIRKITRKGPYSYLLVLPKEIVSTFKWRDHQKVEITIDGREKIAIKDWKPKRVKKSKKK